MSVDAHMDKLVRKTGVSLTWAQRISAFGPFLVLMTALICAAVLGLFETASPKAHALMALLALILAGLFLARGLQKSRPASVAEAKAHVDRLSDLQPASTLEDSPASYDPQTVALWKAHQTRTAQHAQSLKPLGLFTALRRKDRGFLHILGPLALIASGVYAGAQAPSRLLSATLPDWGALMGADTMMIQAWVSPPSYTGEAPFDLVSGHTATAPSGAEIVVRIESPLSPVLKIQKGDASSKQRLKRLEDGAFEARLTLDEAITAQVHSWGERASYRILDLGDNSPVTSFITTPGLGEMDRTSFGWKASDDYGLASVSFELKPLDERYDADALTSLIPLEIGAVEPKSAEDQVELDLTRHRLAGLEVEARLVAQDAGGKIGYSDPVTFKLPEKLFIMPVAKAAAEIRSDVLREWREYADGNDKALADLDNTTSTRLEFAPLGVRSAAMKLDALTYAPDTYFNDRPLYLGLRRAHSTLKASRDLPDTLATDDLLWMLALRAEYGDLASAEAALEAAKRALAQALRDGADDAEIERLMQAFKDAVSRFLQARLAEAMRRGEFGMEGGGMGGPQLGDDELTRMLEALEDLAETGARDQARQLLSDVTDMLSNLRAFTMNPSDGLDSPPQDGPLSDAMEKLAESLRDQRDLRDDTEQAESGSSGEDGQSAEELAQRQADLAETLREMAPQPGGDGEEGESGDGQTSALDGEIGEWIERALEGQQDAEESLREGDLRGAQLAQKEVEEALSRGATALADWMDRRSEELGAGGEDRVDPLGEPINRPGAVGDGDDVVVPDEAERQRARDILEKLRDKSSKQDLTPEEKDYIKRLLERF